MLNLASSVIDHPICFIINLSIASSSYPSMWKRATVKPLHKGGPHDTLNNYRPISLLPAASKILEGVIRDQVYSHLQSHGLLSPCQSGFRPGHSTSTTLLHVTNKWHIALDQGQLVGAVFWTSPRHSTLSITCCSHASQNLALTVLFVSGSTPTWLIDISALPSTQSTRMTLLLPLVSHRDLSLAPSFLHCL